MKIYFIQYLTIRQYGYLKKAKKFLEFFLFLLIGAYILHRQLTPTYKYSLFYFNYGFG